MGRPNTIASASFQHSSATTTALTHTEAATAGKTHAIQWALISFDTVQAGGTMTVTVRDGDGSAAIIHLVVVAGAKGTRRINFPGGLWGTEGNALTIQMGAANNNVGYLTTKVLTY